MKIPSNDKINSISSKIKLNIDDTKYWFKWINESYLYINYQIKINKLNLLIKEHHIINDKNNKHFILNKPDFVEKKSVSV